MIKYFIFFILFSIPFLATWAQPDPASNHSESSSEASSRPLLEISVRREDAKYRPYQYYESLSYQSQMPLSDITGNRVIFTPFDIRLKSATRSWGLDLSYQTFNLRNYGYDYLYIGIPVSYSYFYHSAFNPLKREDIRLLGFFYPITGVVHQFGIGFGARNINLSDGYSSAFYGYYFEKFHNYGPEISAKYRYRFAEKFSISLQTGYFYTRGNRIYERGTIAYNGVDPPIPMKSWGSSATKGELAGFDSRAVLSYAFRDNITIDLGYHYTFAWFHYINYYDISLPYNRMFYNNYYHNSKEGYNPDVIRGVSLGITVAIEFLPNEQDEQ